MAAKCKKCDPHEICEECPEWIFTLADLIMCMMGLFVILWVLKPGLTAKSESASSSAASSEKLTQVIAAIREAFGHEVDPASRDPIDIYMLMQHIPHRSDGEKNKGMQTNQTPSPEGSDPDVTSIRRGKQSLVGTRLMFDKGATSFSADQAANIAEIVNQIKGHRNIVVIKGHVALDDFPDNATPQQKMALSVQRAQAAADALVKLGVSPEIMRLEGCSTFEPVLQRVYTPEAIAKNRRVEVEVTSSLLEDFQNPGKEVTDVRGDAIKGE